MRVAKILTVFAMVLAALSMCARRGPAPVVAQIEQEALGNALANSAAKFAQDAPDNEIARRAADSDSSAAAPSAEPLAHSPREFSAEEDLKYAIIDDGAGVKITGFARHGYANFFSFPACT